MAQPSDFVPSSERLTVDAYQSTASDYVIYLEHFATYDFVRPYVAGRAVLDFGCGTGYGTHRLAPECASIVGVDIAADAIRFAEQTYQAPNLSYRAISSVETTPLPFDDASFETVISFQVIEHITDVDRCFAEIARVLAPHGTFVCATPDRRMRLFPQQRPWNVYHVHEFGPEELDARLRAHFADVAMHGMTGPADLIQHETKRWRRTRLVTLPMTFPGAPEAWRTRGLRLLKRIQGDRYPAAAESARALDADHSGFRVTSDPAPSLNLVAVATKA